MSSGDAYKHACLSLKVQICFALEEIGNKGGYLCYVPYMGLNDFCLCKIRFWICINACQNLRKLFEWEAARPSESNIFPERPCKC